MFKTVFMGNIFYSCCWSNNGSYQWSIKSKNNVLNFLEYFQSSTASLKSHKSKRFFLIKDYYALYKFKAFKPDSVHHKAWIAFIISNKWNKLKI